MQQPARTKSTPVRLDIRHLEMRTPESYPFGQVLPHVDSVVHLGRNYEQSTFEQHRNTIAEHQRLTHPNLIQVLRVVDSKRNHRLDLFYEWVPMQLAANIRMLAGSELNDVREVLCSLVEYLVERGFSPQFEPQLVGLTNHRTVKLLLPLSCDKLDRSVNKVELMKKKKEQVNALMFMVTRPFREDQPTYEKPPEQQLVKSKSGGSLGSSQSPSDKAMAPIRDGQQSLLQRNSHTAETKKVSQPMMGSPQNRPLQVNESTGTGRQVSSTVGSGIGSTNGDHITKLKNIDKRIKQLEGNRKSYAEINVKSMQTNEIKKSQQLSPPTQQQEPSPQRVQVVRQEKPVEKPPTPIQVSAPSPRNKPKKQFDEDSQDTYQQELGEVVEMPKITGGSGGLRSTTLAPPKPFAGRKEKLSESVGFHQQMKLPLPAISAGSVCSDLSENRSMPTQSKNVDMQKKVLKRSDTQILVPKLAKSQTSKDKQRTKNSPDQSPQSSQNDRRRQQTQQPPPQQQVRQQQQTSPQYHTMPQTNFNLNLNVAVNLGDLSKKVDAAYGRVRAVSQNNETVLKSTGLQTRYQTTQQQQPQSQSPPQQQQPTKQDNRKPVAKPGQRQPEYQSRTHNVFVEEQQPEPKRYQAPQAPQQPQPQQPPQLQFSKPADPSPRQYQRVPQQEKLNYGLVISTEAHYSKNRKSSDTAPKMVLLSPARLENKKPSLKGQPQNEQPSPSQDRNRLMPPVVEARKDSRTQIEEDFRELHRKKELKNEIIVGFEQEKSREYLYQYEKIFPDSVDDRDDLSVRDPQALQLHLDALYKESLKSDKNNALVSAFNSLLFDTDSNRRLALQTKSVDLSPKLIEAAPSQATDLERGLQINERVRLALKKSEATLEYFSRMKKFPENST